MQCSNLDVGFFVISRVLLNVLLLSVAVVTDSLTDVDKVLIHLEAKDYTVEHSTLQSLQQLIQWVADLAVNILARLPEQRAAGRTSGVSLVDT